MPPAEHFAVELVTASSFRTLIIAIASCLLERIFAQFEIRMKYEKGNLTEQDGVGDHALDNLDEMSVPSASQTKSMTMSITTS